MKLISTRRADAAMLLSTKSASAAGAEYPTALSACIKRGATGGSSSPVRSSESEPVAIFLPEIPQNAVPQIVIYGVWKPHTAGVVAERRLTSSMAGQGGRNAGTENDAQPARRHRGDIMSPEKRSALMARIKGRDTGPERVIARLLAANGLHPSRHDEGLPGRPDFVFARAGVAVFVDGDFWHGWRFPVWRDKLSAHWEKKIETNRRRDARNFARLRYRGWIVIRLWEHQIEREPDACISRVLAALAVGAKRSLRGSRAHNRRGIGT